MLPDTFAVFILTHGRPDRVLTYNTLRKAGYTGRLYFVVDNEDRTVEKYRQNFGADRVIVFDKKAEADACDEGNNFDERRTITMARNACWGIAERLGVTHFLQLDDDYRNLWYEIIAAHKRSVPVLRFDRSIWLMLEFYNSISAAAIAFAQSGDFIGGLDDQSRSPAKSTGSGHNRGTRYYRFAKRKCMNSFLCSTLRPFRFVGSMNEDVNTYTTLGSRGHIFLTIPPLSVNQTATQSQSGGITDMYQRFGTYCKAFTTVMMMPSAVKVSMMSSKYSRIHHAITWGNCVPCIVHEKYCKPDG